MARSHRPTLVVSILALLATSCSDDLPHRDFTRPSAPGIASDAEPILDETPPVPDWDFGEIPSNDDRLRSPEIHGMDPPTGSTAGGTEVVIQGLGFLHIDRLTFNGVPSVEWSVRGVDEVLAITPPGVAGPATVAVDGRGGSAAFAGLYTYVSDVGLDAVEPLQAPTAGGTRLTLLGSGFSRDVTVIVGARTAIDVQIVHDGKLTAWFPPNDAGPQDIWVFSGDGSAKAVIRQAVRYRAPPTVNAVRPSVGPLEGGTPVEVVGHGFEQDITLVLGGQRVQATVSGDGERMRFVTPPAAAPGTVALSVHAPIGDGGLQSAFAYVDSLDPRPKLHAVRPGHGPVTGGNAVDVLVGQVAVGAKVTFGGLEAACDAADSGVMRCLAPPNDAGAVRVAIKDGVEVSSLAAGYTYLSPLSLTGASPTDGAVTGGAIATLHGSGFEVGSRVWFGPMESPSVRYISGSVLTAVVPPGAAGEVDILVSLRDGRSQATLEAGFEYVDRFRILAIDPDTGAQAGGTYVSILGTGFTPGMRPAIGERDAHDVRFRGSTRYTFKTPPGSPGSVDVQVPGIASLPEAFTYFNPATRYGGVWGRTIAGSVNVTLLSAGTGDPIVGAFAMLGTDPGTDLQGRTDARGQVTLSGPNLTGPISVTAGKEAHENQSFLLIEAENVTMYLTPLVPPTSGGPQDPPPPVDGTIHGFVAGIDKYVPEPRHEDEERIAYVETTRESPYRPNPNPGSNQLTEDGPFTITSRPGDIAVVVVAGLLDRRTDTFVPYRMGAARFLYMPILGVIDEVYVELTVPLTRRIGVTLVDAPVGRDEGPHELQVTPWFDFRPEGWFGGFNQLDAPVSQDFWLEYMPLFRGPGFEGVHLNLLTSMFTEGSRPMVMRWDMDLDWDAMFMDVGPFAAIPSLTDPVGEQPVANNRFAWSVDGGVQPDVWSMRMMTQRYQPIWRIVAPGGMQSMVLPRVEALPGIPPGNHLLTFSGGITDGWRPHEFEYGDLSVRGWDSWSAVWAPFRAASD